MQRSLPKQGTFVCPCCEKKFDNRRGFGTHLGIKHPDYGGAQRYVLEHQLGGIIPLCKCGCDEHVAWHKTEYRFVDYITGHNDTGYNIGEYKLTPEQRLKCNATIKARFADPKERALLIKKNSESVSKAFQNQIVKERHQQAVQASWDRDLVEGNKRRKKRCNDNHIMWKDPDHHSKVFTPEMRAKISLSNMKRGMTRISKEEEMFIAHLQSVFGCNDILSPSWINSPTFGTGCYDVYIRSARCRVEYDGIHHHGLDRQSGWTDWQKKNMNNDRRKDEMIRERLGARLLRVRSDSNWKSVRTFCDLEAIAYADVRGPISSSADVACDKLEHEK